MPVQRHETLRMQNQPHPADFIASLAPALRTAAALARDLEGRVANRPKTGEQSPVKAALTAADMVVQETLLGALRADLPGVALEAEEDTPTAAHFAKAGPTLVVIDPIDGTLRFYLEGLGPYAIMAGLASEGVYSGALVALPREDLFLDALRGEGARIARSNSEPTSLRCSREGHRVLVSHDLPRSAVGVLLAAGFEVAPASGGAISVAPLIPGVRAGIRLVRGGSVSVRGRIGALISREAGARVCGADGQPFPEEIREPASTLLVAADDEDLAVLKVAAAAAQA
ncbi:MAG: hypothetical protein CL938_08865 [Deltaproteobacteria bacterium]|jgi:fructose-1,6-bisphosphatase/inositol monophosphatase family enzyme|nr:hypothetical protein [Deltaproteobacteria bacterium]MBT38641.1 hypothetical protein [Deltaproteobacteria bacterium]